MEYEEPIAVEERRRWKEKTRAALAPISRNEIYPLEVFQKRAGMNSWAMRMARKQGLKIRQVGRRRYVLGEDFYRYLEGLTGEE